MSEWTAERSVEDRVGDLDRRLGALEHLLYVHSGCDRGTASPGHNPARQANNRSPNAEVPVEHQKIVGLIGELVQVQDAINDDPGSLDVQMRRFEELTPALMSKVRAALGITREWPPMRILESANS